MALRRVATSSCCRTKLGFFGAVSNHQNHLLLRPQLSRHFRRLHQEYYNPDTGQFEPQELYFVHDADRLSFWGGNLRNRLDQNSVCRSDSDIKDPEVVEPALFAVKKHNKLKNANLQFVRVVKVIRRDVWGTIYHITLEAIDCGEKKTYETQVWHNAEKGWILELLKFKLEPSNHGNKQDFLSKAVDKKVGAEKKGGGGGGETKEVSQLLNKLDTFLEGYLGSKKNGLDAKEVLDVVSKIPDLSESEVYKACSWLVENERHFRMLKLFADDMKKGYLLCAMLRD